MNCTGGGHVPCNECDHCISITRGSHPDVVEIDAASNNGVDEIRDLVEKVKYAPLEAKYKVYIIDEVHMLSTGAFNALLKTLEEPPAHVIFILATTEPHKVIPTIISRCQRFDFSKVPPKLIAQRVEYVLQKENIQYEKEVVRLISVLAEGGLRDALTILEQVIAYAKDNLKEEHVHEIYGITTIKEKMELLKAVFSKDVNNLLEDFAAIENKSHDINRLTNDLIDILKEAVIYAYAKNDQILQFLDENEAQSILEYHDASTLLAMVDILIDTYEKYRNATNVLAYFEVSLLKMMNILSPLEVVVDQPIVPAKEIVKEVVPVQAQPTPVAVQEVNTIQKTKAEPQVVANTKIEEAQKDETPAVVEVSVSVAERYPIEVLVQCMVGGQKDKRIEDSEKWKALSDYASDLKWAKEARWLMPSEIIVSGESYIVVIVKSQAAANLINETNHDQDYHEFTNLILGKPKQVIAITNETFKTAYETFQKQHRNNSLPKPYHVEIKNTVKKETVVEKAVNLFGEALVEVSEDE